MTHFCKPMSFTEQDHISVQEIIREVGRFVQAEFVGFSRASIRQKGHNDLLSYVDEESEKMLVAHLSQLMLDAGFLTEEAPHITGKNDYTWAIDPIDGTTNFVHSLPFFSISVALQQGEETLAGYVYEVMHEEMFVARKGMGASLNGKAIRVSQVAMLSESLLATGIPSRCFDGLDAYLEMLRAFVLSTQGLRRMGSAALDLAYVSSGRVEGFFERGLSIWDVAAGILLVQEAGGEVSDFQGGQEPVLRREILATNARVHQEMLEVIRFQ